MNNKNYSIYGVKLAEWSTRDLESHLNSINSSLKDYSPDDGHYQEMLSERYQIIKELGNRGVVIIK
jgi:hypothetical protein